MKKVMVLGIGVVFVFLAIVFFVVPGPSIIFAMAALVCFSIYYPTARKYLRKLQKIFTKACHKLDGIK
ncbi:PGPGW domain-containing protein [Pseudoalteromonas sp. MMG005]|uniref:PGPGW domain-containing protein n=1 Tax=Pseudoalteromonas sp. MMG005 TaxID=2822682 RepID=UPI001B3A286F|nr:PGPGW domain-containing protein [Pseudoalteromonas sp. MMG005]MBQ4846697.1 hypothetical protein [Pseudoalteromonas sp. MMG005]